MPENPCKNLSFDHINGFGLFFISFVLILSVPILSVLIYFVLIYMWHVLSNNSRFLVEKSKFSEMKLSNTKRLQPPSCLLTDAKNQESNKQQFVHPANKSCE